ncbi:kinase-like domain-containing protein [Trichoderma austrokoningii]
MRGIFYFAKFNLEALLSLCEQLGGRKCTCDDVTKMPKSGSLNWVIFVTFEDGIEWVFRCPMAVRNQFYSEETSSKIVNSEAATLMYLKAHTSIPVPEVYSYSGTSDNSIGVPYILQSKAAGRSLGSYDWSQDPNRFTGMRNPPQILPMSEKGREKVMEQLGSIMAELSDHRFTEIGSLFKDGGGDYTIGECLSPMLTWQERDSLDLDRGPFRQEHDYLVSLISAFTSHAQELPLSPHIFYAPVPDDLHYKSTDSAREASQRWNEFVAIGDKIYHSKNRHMYCMVGQMLAEMIPHLSSGVEGSFTLSHPDLHVGNIYVDDDLNITCIIDWSSTSTGPITELLTTPGLGGSARPPSVNLTAAFRTGFGQTCTKIGPELSQSNLWQVSDNMWPFSRLIRLLSKNDYEHFRRLFELVYKPSAEEAGLLLHLLHERAKTDENQKLLIELQEYDMTAEEQRKEEQKYFSPARRANSDAVAVARKLTIMSEMNPGFLANHVLWQWVEEALKQDDPQ